MNLLLFGGRRGSRQKESWITVDQPWKHYGDDILHSGGVGVTLIRGVSCFDRDSCTREVCCSCDSAAVARSGSQAKRTLCPPTCWNARAIAEFHASWPPSIRIARGRRLGFRRISPPPRKAPWERPRYRIGPGSTACGNARRSASAEASSPCCRAPCELGKKKLYRSTAIGESQRSLPRGQSTTAAPRTTC